MIIIDAPQNSPAWFSARLGKPTASEFSSIVTGKGEESKSRYGYALTLAAEVFAGQRLDAWEGNAATVRGHEMEGWALDAYSFVKDLELTRVGFCTTDDGAYGCSPDALAGDKGLVEVKSLSAKRHIEAMMYHKKNGCCPPDYVQQTQGQMMVTGRSWVDLVFYHPQLPMLIIRQTPILPVVAGLAAGIKALLAERDSVVDMLRRAA